MVRRIHVLSLATILSILLSAAALAADVTVNCDVAGQTIGAALSGLNPAGPNTITVTGTCREAVVISHFNRLTIQAPPSLRAQLLLSGCGEPGAAPKAALRVEFSQDITLRRLEIHGGHEGLSVDSSSVLLEEGVVVEYGKTHGVLIDGPSKVTFNGAAPASGNLIRNNCGIGVWARTGTSLSFNGPNSILNNSGNGILAFHGGTYVQLNAGSDATILVEGNSHGLRAIGQAAFDLFGGVVVRNNTGPGISLLEDGQASLVGWGSQRPLVAYNRKGGVLVTSQGKLMLYGATITDNADEGIRLEYMSLATVQDSPIQGTPPGNTISRNGGADLTCDKSSVAAGHLKQDVGKLKCPNAQPE